MKQSEPFFKTSHGRAPLTLELQFKTRDCEALTYAYLLRVRHDMTGSIEIHFSSVKVVIEGSSLQPLYEALKEQTVVSVREADGQRDVFDGTGIFVRSIETTAME